MSQTDKITSSCDDALHLVTVSAGLHRFGLPIGRVRDVFEPTGITPVPLAPPEVVGLLNLRGRVVTAFSLRLRLGLAPAERGKKIMAVGLEQGEETFALMIDGIGEVMALGLDTFEAVPANLDARWRSLARGVHRLDAGLLTVLDVDELLAFAGATSIAQAA